MMRNRQFLSLYMDFDRLRDNGYFPSDIDFMYLFPDGYLTLGDFKLKGNHLHGKQAEILTRIIDGHKRGGCLLEIEHVERVQDGATTVDVSSCPVRRAYFGGRWHRYRDPLNVLAWIERLNKKHSEQV